MKSTVALFGLLLALWLLASGIYDHAQLLVFGVLSCAGVALLARRMGIADEEAVPVHLVLRSLVYVPWLAKEVLLANLDVARRVLGPRLPISPRILVLHPTQRTDLCRVLYANSITLTPGTVSIEAEGGTITVHAIAEEVAEGLEKGEMDRRVCALEGGS